MLKLFLGDITTLDVEAVVNAANSELAGGGGVDGAIHRAAGKTLIQECLKIRQERGKVSAGQAVSTGAGEMKAKFVIHAVGPFYLGGLKGEDKNLRGAYLSSLEEADRLGVSSLAFPAISTGVYFYPQMKAAPIAVEAVKDYLNEKRNTSIKLIVFALYSRGAYEIYDHLFDSLSSLSR